MATEIHTDNVHVAAIMAALEISEAKSISQSIPGFDQRLQNFLIAYKAIASAVDIGSIQRSPHTIDVESLFPKNQ